MKLNKTILYFIFISMFLHSCIEEYIPTIEFKEANKYVISGILTDQEGYHEISISLSSSVNNPQIIPVSGCIAKLFDDSGNFISYTEYKSGVYRSWIAQSFLSTGIAYKLEITTPDGTNIVSDFEEMLECPKIDSVYFIREDLPTNNPDVLIEGIQFYLDLDATNTDSKYFKVDIEETWEYHAMYPLEWYYDGAVRRVEPPDYSNFVCYKTEQVKDICILNTSDLEVNKFKKSPLHYVDNKTSRLAYKYCILIKQYTLNEKSYTFWDQLYINNLNDANLYETQAFPVHGNLNNLTNPEINVLGYFQVSAIKTKRFFINKVENLELDYYTFCSSSIIRKNYLEYGPEDYPVYLLRPLVELNKECVICPSHGGTTIKPEFWP